MNNKTKLLRSSLCCFLLFISFMLEAKESRLVSRIDPPHWYNGLNDTLQLLFYGEELSNAVLTITNGNASVIKVHKLLNHSYLIGNVLIDKKFTGTLTFKITCGNKHQTLNFEILPVTKSNLKIDKADVMYLLMPDRFANGDTLNDNPRGVLETTNRNKPKGRHGGDIKGIYDHINYLQELGITSLWINPLTENNQPVESYHGYAFTDLYNIDKRFGSNANYRQLSSDLQKQGIKLIMDVVYNHSGDQWLLYRNMIDSHWFHIYDTFTRTNYRGAAVVDPYASAYDKRLMSNGWFDRHMPDLNQQNTELARYLIQNTLWWIAYAQLSGIRIDTYPYPDLHFMTNLVHEIKKYFPDVFVFGETWEHGEPLQAYFARNNAATSFKSKLDGVTDFQLYFALNKAFTEPFGWTEGLAKLYYVLTKDYLYLDAGNNIIFADNHDLDRFLGVVNNDKELLKQCLGFLFTTRGIPCVYYGTEILMNDRGDHGLLRKDMPGGWPADSLSVFLAYKRSAEQSEMISFIRLLSDLRHDNADLFNHGKLTQFIPENGTYCYARSYKNSTMFVAINQQQSKVKINTQRFGELAIAGIVFDYLNKKEIYIDNEIEIPAKGITIFTYSR